ncbi:BRCA2 oligonucleotide/oligosaccharide-binding domain-containing protein [Chloropicon primus]|nr:BRCA2 oligonucleotide/oligosaccharide-binding domain-containing protein [Chloropicon primus]
MAPRGVGRRRRREGGKVRTELRKGTRVEVLFDDPPEYYAGTVERVTRKGKEGNLMHHIHYDDGTREDVNLDAEDTMYRVVVEERVVEEEVVEDSVDEEEEDVVRTRKRYRGKRDGGNVLESTSDCVNDSQEEEEGLSQEGLEYRRKHLRIGIRRAQDANEGLKQTRASQHSVSKAGKEEESLCIHETDCVLETQVVGSPPPWATEEADRSPLVGSIDPNSQRNSAVVRDSMPMQTLTPITSVSPAVEDHECVPESPFSEHLDDVRMTIADSPSSSFPALRSLTYTADQQNDKASEQLVHVQHLAEKQQTLDEAVPSTYDDSDEVARGALAPAEHDVSVDNANNASSLFKFASGKAVNISEDALAKARSFLADSPGENGEDALTDKTNVVAHDSDAGKNPKDASSLFKFASGKAVNISEDALAKARSFLADSPGENGEDALTDKTNVVAHDSDAGKDPKDASSLFKFASGKAVNISEDALAKARSFLADSPGENREDALTDKTNVVAHDSDAGKDLKDASSLFKFASGKAVNISEDALAKARSFLADSPGENGEDALTDKTNVVAHDSDAGKDPKDASSLFKFASGKAVNISEDALAKARSFLADSPGENGEDALTDKTNVVAHDSDAGKDPKDASSLFKFASGKAVNISEDALAKARSFLADSPGENGEDAQGGVRTDLAVIRRVKREDMPPVFNLSEGVGEKCAGKFFYALEDAGNGQRISYKSLEEMDLRLFGQQRRRVLHDDGLKRAQLSCTSICEGGGGKIVSSKALCDLMIAEGHSQCKPEWVEHHRRMIVMKFMKLELQFENIFKNRLVCAEALYSELCRRYRKEIVRGKCSCIHQILMREVPCEQRMILSVTRIISASKLELSDGWYTINGQLDKLLCLQLSLDKIFVGKKLCVSTCELHNAQEACHPLEMGEGVFLSLSYNGVFPAKWNERLGFTQRNIPLVGLPQVEPLGGIVPSTIVLIEKQYPLIFMEKKEDGAILKRNEVSEQEARDKFDYARDTLKEDILEKMQNDCREEDFLDSDKMDSLAHDFNQKVEKVFREHSLLERNVTPLLNLRVSQVLPPHKKFKKRMAIVSQWRPADDLKDLLRPGKIFRVFNLMPKPSSSPDMIQLDGTKATQWIPMGTMSEQKPYIKFQMNDGACESIESLVSQRKGHEFDCSGVLISAEKIDESNFSVFMITPSQLKPENSEDDSWLLRVTVHKECTGLRNLKQAKISQTLCFQNLSFDFADERNCVINCKAGIQSICARKVARSSTLLSSDEILSRLGARVISLCGM